MIEYPEHIATAIGICPLVDKLYQMGILCIGGTNPKSVQMTNEAFHKEFHTWYPVDNPNGWEEHHHRLMGIDFFCLCVKGREEDV